VNCGQIEEDALGTIWHEGSWKEHSCREVIVARSELTPILEAVSKNNQQMRTWNHKGSLGHYSLSSRKKTFIAVFNK
jgi:hypothetical protein